MVVLECVELDSDGDFVGWGDGSAGKTNKEVECMV